MKKKTIIFFSVLILLTGCTLTDKQTLETKIMEHVPYPKSTELLHTESYKDGTIVLYKDKSGFRAGFFKKDYFDGSGNAELNPKDGMDYTMVNDPNVPITLFAGVITERNLARLVVKQKTVKKTAKIIPLDDGNRIWLAAFERLEDSEPDKPDLLKIEGFDKAGSIVWKDGIYEGVYFRGKINQP